VSDDFHTDVISVGGKRLDVGSVAGEDCAAWLGDGHNSCAVNARMSETEVFVRAVRRENPPLSRTSTFS